MMAANNKPAKEKEGGLTTPQAARREISSGIIIFRRVNGDIRFLILYHGRNQWEIPRGKIEAEERSFAAALRETREETGFTRSDLQFVDYFKAYENWTFIKNNQRVHKTIIYYLAQTTKKHPRLEPSFEGYGWFTYRESLHIFVGVKNNENRKVIKQAYDFLEGKRAPLHRAPMRRNIQPPYQPSTPPRPLHKHSEGSIK